MELISLLLTNDHIFDVINTNWALRKIFISIHGDPNSEGNVFIQEKVKVWKERYPHKEYILYDAETANVWGETP